MSDALERGDLAKVDKSGMIDDICAMPEHLRDALWRAESAAIPELDTRAGMLVCGMGGSAIGGDLLIAAYGDSLLRPLHVVRGYGLPSWATGDMAVLCSSYSGNTEETLACFDAAGAVGAPRVVATTGGKLAELAREAKVPVIGLPSGLQPRAAVAYLFVAAAEVAAKAEAGPGLRSDISRATSHLESLVEKWGPGPPTSVNLAKQLAEAAKQPLVAAFGADLTVAPAHRFATQVNENAKSHAYWLELPEANHNEVVGWDDAGQIGKRFALFLEDSDQHPRVGRRIKLTEELLAASGAQTMRLASSGETRTDRLFSLVLAADLASVYLAVMRGIDPTPVETIERFKKELDK